MTPQELKKLGRTDLVQLILQQEREMDAMQARIVNMERQERERSFRMKKFGSLAEASLQLNGVFEAAQRAANQYLESAARHSAACKQQKQESDRLLAQTKEECARLEEETQRKCKEMLEKAERDAKAYWGSMEQDLLKRLEDYVPEWHGMEPELLGSLLEELEDTLEETAAPEEIPEEVTEPEEIPEEVTEPEEIPEEMAELTEETEPVAETQLHTMVVDDLDLDEFKRLIGDL